MALPTKQDLLGIVQRVATDTHNALDIQNLRDAASSPRLLAFLENRCPELRPEDPDFGSPVAAGFQAVRDQLAMVQQARILRERPCQVVGPLTTVWRRQLSWLRAVSSDVEEAYRRGVAAYARIDHLGDFRTGAYAATMPAPPSPTDRMYPLARAAEETTWLVTIGIVFKELELLRKRIAKESQVLFHRQMDALINAVDEAVESLRQRCFEEFYRGDVADLTDPLDIVIDPNEKKEGFEATEDVSEIQEPAVEPRTASAKTQALPRFARTGGRRKRTSEEIREEISELSRPGEDLNWIGVEDPGERRRMQQVLSERRRAEARRKLTGSTRRVRTRGGKKRGGRG
ncbi:hypothetical protein KC349_g2985 [Hortaea werneckii]|nr:hypothetical protein KC349_g2985 [Hortaea werneckii]